MSDRLPFGQGNSPAMHQARLVRLQHLAQLGCNMAEAARDLGISRSALTQWFDRQGHAALRRRLKDNAHGNTLSPATARKRLLVLRRAESLSAAARQLGMSPPGLWLWLQRYAPDGVEDALGDWV